MIFLESWHAIDKIIYKIRGDRFHSCEEDCEFLKSYGITIGTISSQDIDKSRWDDLADWRDSRTRVYIIDPTRMIVLKFSDPEKEFLFKLTFL